MLTKWSHVVCRSSHSMSSTTSDKVREVIGRTLLLVCVSIHLECWIDKTRVEIVTWAAVGVANQQQQFGFKILAVWMRSMWIQFAESSVKRPLMFSIFKKVHGNWMKSCLFSPTPQCILYIILYTCNYDWKNRVVRVVGEDCVLSLTILACKATHARLCENRTVIISCFFLVGACRCCLWIIFMLVIPVLLAVVIGFYLLYWRPHVSTQQEVWGYNPQMLKGICIIN